MKNSLDEVTPAEWDSLTKRRPEYAFGDVVKAPTHYTKGGQECIDYIKQQLDDQYRGYLEGNVLKYMHRYKSKGKPLEDLRKAQVYLGWLIKELENEG
jgi:hypothetical protein